MYHHCTQVWDILGISNLLSCSKNQISNAPQRNKQTQRPICWSALNSLSVNLLEKGIRHSHSCLCSPRGSLGRSQVCVQHLDQSTHLTCKHFSVQQLYLKKSDPYYFLHFSISTLLNSRLVWWGAERYLRLKIFTDAISTVREYLQKEYFSWNV